MLQETLIELFERDLGRLKAEVLAYRDESKLWHIDGEIKNSAGNLVLHLVGNLNHFIGATLGKAGYIRDREREFATKNIARGDLVEQIDATMRVIRETLAGLSAEDLGKIYPLEVLGKKNMTTMFFLVHLTTHLNYHLGQINYHRRLCD